MTLGEARFQRRRSNPIAGGGPGHRPTSPIPPSLRAPLICSGRSSLGVGVSVRRVGRQRVWMSGVAVSWHRGAAPRRRGVAGSLGRGVTGLRGCGVAASRRRRVEGSRGRRVAGSRFLHRACEVVLDSVLGFCIQSLTLAAEVAAGRPETDSWLYCRLSPVSPRRATRRIIRKGLRRVSSREAVGRR